MALRGCDRHSQHSGGLSGQTRTADGSSVKAREAADDLFNLLESLVDGLSPQEYT